MGTWNVRPHFNTTWHRQGTPVENYVLVWPLTFKYHGWHLDKGTTKLAREYHRDICYELKPTNKKSAKNWRVISPEISKMIKLYESMYDLWSMSRVCRRYAINTILIIGYWNFTFSLKVTRRSIDINKNCFIVNIPFRFKGSACVLQLRFF